MRRIFFGFLAALVGSILLSLITSVIVCLGAHPLLFEAMDGATPVLGMFLGAYLTARGDWRVGTGSAAVFVAGWLILWLYLQARWNVFLWLTEGVESLTPAHFAGWIACLAAGALGGALSRWRFTLIAGAFTALYAVALLLADQSLASSPSPAAAAPGAMEEESFGPAPDGTLGWLHTFHLQLHGGPRADVYDCDSDGPRAFVDTNTRFLGQDLAALARRLNHDVAPQHTQVLCLVNGGFFGASGWSVAHHEEPMVDNHVAHYRVDLLRPKDQAWFLGINPPEAVENGQPRFEMTPEPPLQDTTVLGGVRPLRFAGRSVELKPGAGATTLKCSRTSVGWSDDGATLYILTVFDPDGEMASQLQRRSGRPQTGGWDVRDVQKFWEDRAVPYAVLFDGGESTQLAARRPDGTYLILPSGYQYSFTLGYFRERPLRFTLPILPPSEAHRGVLNYFYVAGAMEAGS